MHSKRSLKINAGIRRIPILPEVYELREPLGLGAEVAGEGPLAGVNEGVAPQLGRRRKLLAALIAAVLSSGLSAVASSLDRGDSVARWL